jgi:hypothetical protein
MIFRWKPGKMEGRSAEENIRIWKGWSKRKKVKSKEDKPRHVYCYLIFLFFMHVRGIAKSYYWLRHFCLCIRMEQLGTHGTYFDKTFYLGIFRNRIPFKSDKNNGHFAWRPELFMIKFRWILLRMRKDSDKICRGNQNTNFMFGSRFSENSVFFFR